MIVRRGSWSRFVTFVLAAAVVSACSRSTLPDHAGATTSAQVTNVPSTSVEVAPSTAAPATTAVPAGATEGLTTGKGDAAGGQPPSQSSTASTTGASVAPPQVGLTDKAITISVSGPFSGIYGAVFGHPYTYGFEAWQKDVNARGGINGRQVVLRKVDNQLTADGAIAACKETTSNKSFMVVIYASSIAEDDCEDAAGIPVFDTAPGSVRPSWRNVLSGHTGDAFAPVEASYLRSLAKDAAGHRIGIVCTCDVAGYASVTRAITDALPKEGLQLARVEKVASNQSSFVAEMSRMKGAGAGTVLLVVALEGPGVLRDARAIGFNPTWVAETTSGAAFDVGSKAGNQLFKGIHGLRFSTTTETPAFARYQSLVKKYYGQAAVAGLSDLDVGAYGWADILGHLLELAGPNLTRAGILAAGRAMPSYSPGYLTPFQLVNRRPPIGLLALFPAECCKSDFTWRVTGPARDHF